ncbi:TonB-linked SusC/RagA family outer membrane protein [Marinilabilia salmonicolor]|jgi:TonB-linked SusC/RagA family outer membrane protein|uniref:SusC/RagA family TonB-linked outer membrane protein n=1 Tax=Marinilabilia salmonicolor TaxID=989 RepID=UPI000D49987A|nr:TonB-dependent receptor [Marinilabilia salmonicolor]PRZ01360.1 TonB-linked SusC/RagA family outer membrane protein [Marinilabilia salmonicolor]
MRKNLRFFLAMFFLAFQVMAFGQGKTVTGNVTDETGAPLPGVSVVIQGTTQGTITDMDGNYSVTLEEGQNVLQFSFIGFENQTIDVSNQSVVDVQMEPETRSIDEVVVVGYGSMKKSDVSTASVSVKGEDLQQTVSANLDQALQGRAAGVTAISTSGQPGASVSIRIRGQSTLSAGSAEPLYVVDGVPIQNVSQGGHGVGLGDKLGNAPVSTFGGGLSNINPADIESMEILKDASATAIYGSRGANGVVLITTKRGKSGEAKFNYNFQYGIQEQAKRIDVMDLRQYASYSNNIAAETEGRESREELLDPSLLGAGTDWQDAVFQTAPMQNHQISASGGTEKSKYFISGSYFDQEGTVVGSGYERFTGRVNLDSELKDWWTIGTNITFAQSEDQLGLNNSDNGIINVALKTSPDVPVYNVDGSWSGDEREGSPGKINPIAKALDEEIRLERTNFTANVYSDITFIEGLTLRTEASMDVGNTNAYTFTPTYQYGNVANTQNSSRWQYNKNRFWELKNYLTYSRSFGRHSASLMAGQEVSESTWEYLSGSSSALPSNLIHSPSLGDNNTMVVGSGFGSGSMASFFSRANYNYSSKYYLTYTYRYDGSSNFGPENRWAPFHAFSGMWRVSDEPFWDGLSGIVNSFKIRAGWGQTGNASIGGYQWGASITKMPTGLGDGYRQTNIANPYIQWEKQEQYNLGIDLGFFDNRIDVVVDLYHKTSSDMLMAMQLPSYMGTRGNESSRLNPPSGNFGEIENKGVEITLNARPVLTPMFRWESGITFTMNDNTLLGLTGTPSAHIEGYGQWSDVVTMTELGQSLYGFYGYEVDRVFTSKEDIINSPRQEAFPNADPETGDLNWDRATTTWVGDLKFKDLSGPNGKPDGVIDEHDKTFLGSPWPTFSFGWNNTFRYKNVELTVFMNGNYGNKVLNYIGRSLSGMDNMWDNQLAEVTDRTILGPINDVEGWYNDIDNVQIVQTGKDNMPRAIAGDPNDNMRISDRYIEDGSYLRFKNISLAYYVPNRLTSRWGIDNLKLSAGVQNLYTITKYSGFDPEIGASQTSQNVYGLDNGRYPAPRIYTVGLNVSF